MRSNISLHNFSGGELAPRMRGRYDLPVYQNGCERLVNFIAETQGPISFRTGTRFVAMTRRNNKAVLIPFKFNAEQAYVLEFTAGYMRIFKDEGAVVEVEKNITGVSQANPGVVTVTAHGFSNGNEVYIAGVGGMTSLNGKNYLVANALTNTFTLTDLDGNAINTSALPAYTSGGVVARVVEITTPYTEADLAALKYAQTADVMYIVHPGYEPRKLTRSSHTAWTLATYSRTSDPFTGAGKYPGAVSFYESRLVFAGTNDNPTTVWFSRSPDATGAVRYDDFTTGTDATNAIAFTIAGLDVARIEWLAGLDRFLAIGSYSSIFKATGTTADEAIAPTSINIRPVDFYGVADIMPAIRDNIIVYAQRDGLTARSFEFDVLSDGYVSVDRNLVADHITAGGLTQLAYQVGRPDVLWAVRADGVLLGLTFKSREDVSGWHRHTTQGLFESICGMQRATQYDQLWAVVQRDINGHTRRFVEFFTDPADIPEPLDFYEDATAKDTELTKFDNAMFEAQKEYIHLDASLSYDGSDIGLSAGASVTPAASSGTSVTFTASASVFTAAMVGREIWRKAIDGVGHGRARITAYTSGTVVTCEILREFDSTTAIPAGEWYLTTDSVAGLEHLEGCEVAVVTDGAIHPLETVISGVASLDYQASKIHVGLRYQGLYKSMNLEFGGVNGPAQTKPRNISKAGIKFINTLGAYCGTDVYSMTRIPFRTGNSYTGRPQGLYSGVLLQGVTDSWGPEKHILLEQRQPLPCNVQVIMVYGSTSND
jgi:hypothetical protein